MKNISEDVLIDFIISITLLNATEEQMLTSALHPNFQIDLNVSLKHLTEALQIRQCLGAK